MNAIKLLRQAQRADQLGNYKLADRLYNQAYRYAGGERAIEEAVIKALEEAGIKSSEAITTEALVAAVDKAIAEAVSGGDKSVLEALLREAGAAEDDVAKIVEKVAAEGAAALEKDALILKLSESLNGPAGIARRMNIVPPTKPSFMDKGKEMFGKISEKWQALKDNPAALKKLKIAGIVVVGVPAVALGAPAVVKFINEKTGKPATDQEIENALNGNDPYKNMYEDRMKAGQQQRQNDEAQKFFDENKDKFKSQREFYNAAKAKGDENFANSAIAILKKNMPELPREPQSK